MMKLVATDLDGTIVRRDGTVSPRTLAVLRALEDAGVDVVFVTGRPPRWMAPVLEWTGHLGEAICGNGAFVYDLRREQVTASFSISPVACWTAASRLRALMPQIRFAVERVDSSAHEPDFLTRNRVAGTQMQSLSELLAVSAGKLLARDPTSLADAMLALAAPILRGLVEVTHSNPGDCLLEMSAIGVSKASTLARLCADRGISPQDVVAFGDMPNDLPMLNWAGRGYAVDGGHADVLAAVALRAPSCEDDGVAQVLEALLASASSGGELCSPAPAPRRAAASRASTPRPQR